jgi:uncharacterized membrane protein
MEVLIAIIFGGAIIIGSLAGFISLFTKGDKDAKLRELEKEVAKLGNRLARLENPQPSEQEAQTTIAVETKTEEASISIPIEKEVLPDPVIAHEVAPETTQEATAFKDNNAAQINDNGQSAITTAIKPKAVKPKPIEPNIVDKAFNYAKDWLFGGNTLVRSGIVLLFIGISFLIKYVAENSNVPIEFRMAGIALFGVGLLVLGWRLRNKRKEYAWALQGGGIGVLYLTVFAAMKLYQLIPPSAAFILLIIIAFLSAGIAVLQSAMPLAILGFTGGFLAPIFTSSGSGSHVGLFSYYLILNLAIVFIAYHKSWRPLNVLGFAFTFIIGTIWGAKSYQPAFFATTEPFLIIHFLLFTLVAVLYAHRQATKASDYVDATLVFGTPLVGFSLQYALLRDSNFGLAYSALALAIFYMALAWWVLTRKRDTMQFLGECFLALGIGFATLTLPLALDGRWTSAAWAVEGVGLLWVGLKQNRKFPALSGLALQLLGSGAFVFGWGLTGHSAIEHQNMYLGVAFIALAGWACGALIHQYHQEKWPWLTNALAIWGWLWWFGAGLTAIDSLLPVRLFEHASLAFIAITSACLPMLAKRLKWPKLAKLSVLLLPVMAFTTLFEMTQSHPFARYGLLSWGIAFVAYITLLVKQHIIPGNYFRAPLLWIGALILGMEWHYQLQHFTDGAGVWHDIGWSVVPMLLIAGVTYWQFSGVSILEGEALAKAKTWSWTGCAPLMLFVLAWFLFMSLNSDGNAAPLTYIPILNPLDITLTSALLLFIIWHRHMTKYFHRMVKITPIVAGIMAFTLLNGMLLRTLHHWADTPFRWESVFDYPIVSMAFTFMWAISAFILMLLAHKKAMRILWIVGAALMALVVAKIFLLDLAQTGTVERIASFIGAGIMLLVMGYFAPLPPAKSSEQAIEKED